jgi:Cys-tRNA(Pro)/Cys-tRNA(Cys) deacylase
VARSPAIAAVEQAGTPFEVLEYEHDPKAESWGLEAAELLGWEPARVFKTLVISIDGALAVALVPVDAQLDLRALGKRARMADVGHAERTTGYVKGGISPLGQRKQLPTTLDDSALEHETILVNAGGRGLQLELAPADLVELTGADLRKIARR